MKHRILIALAAVGVFSAGSAFAQQPTKTKLELKEAQPGLISTATVKLDNAQNTALATWKGSHIVSEKIQKRGDRLVYTFRLNNGKQYRNVTVDAKSGDIVKPQAKMSMKKGK